MAERKPLFAFSWRCTICIGQQAEGGQGWSCPAQRIMHPRREVSSPGPGEEGQAG